MKKSLSQELLEALRNKNGWVHSVELEDLARSLGYKSSNSGRRMRELFNAGKVEREYRLHDGVRIVYYKYIDHRPPQVLPQYQRESVRQLTMRI